MKIGDEVYIHGFVDEIRTDTVIIKNRGGYFGTVKNEIVTDIKPNDKENLSSYWTVSVGSNGWNEWTDLTCPVCDTKFEHIFWPKLYKYCPRCKTRLRLAEEKE